VLMHAPKNGYFYVFDRKTGALLSAKNFVPINWSTGIDPRTHRAIVDAAAVDYSTGPKAVFPWGGGAHSWTPMAYSPETGLVYIPTSEGTNILFDPGYDHARRVGLSNSQTRSIALGGFTMVPPGDLSPELQSALKSPDLLKNVPDSQRNMRAYLDAWDPVEQKRSWRVELPNLFDRSGVLATAGNIVVQGNVEGELAFYDARNGSLLRKLDVGTSIIAAPMTYTVDGEQFIAVMAGIGGGPLSFAPPPGSAADRYGNAGRIIAFKLGGSDVPKPDLLPPVPPFPKPPEPMASAAEVSEGARLFAESCARCHLNKTTHGATPDLRRMAAGTHEIFDQIVLKGLLRPLGMPQWDDVYSEQQVNAIHGYLISLAWDAYKQEQSHQGLQQH